MIDFEWFDPLWHVASPFDLAGKTPTLCVNFKCNQAITISKKTKNSLDSYNISPKMTFKNQRFDIQLLISQGSLFRANSRIQKQNSGINQRELSKPRNLDRDSGVLHFGSRFLELI